MKKTVVVGVTGGIAAYKTLDLITRLSKHHLDTRVIMTRTATHIVDPTKFKKASGHPVYTELFPKTFNYQHILKARNVDHITLAQTSSCIIIAPATANIIAKIAHGIADDFLTTTVLAATCPIIICPAMNTCMWTNPVTKQNVQKLRDLGMIIVDPDSGPLACGYSGWGRLAEIEGIEDEILRVIHANETLAGKRVLITSGGTLEKIDDIRFITNKSSGKMGAAIAESCFLRGAAVTLIRAKHAVSPRYNVTEKIFETAEELEQLLLDHIKDMDICFHVAAVSDFTVSKPYTGKTSSTTPLPLELTPKAKILDKIKTYNPAIFLVAFKAEWGVTDNELITLSKRRLRQSRADMIVANDVGRTQCGFGSDENEVCIIHHDDDVIHVQKSNKQIVANQIVDAVIQKM